MKDNARSIKRIKIGMVISTYYPVWGGAQRQLDQIGKYLVEEGIEYFILTRRLGGAKKTEEINGVLVHRLFVTNRWKWLDSVLFTSGALIWLLRNNSRFEILHCYQMYSPATIGTLIKAILPEKKVVVKVTSSDEYGETNEIKRLPFTRARTFLLKLVDKFLVVNRKIYDELSGLGLSPEKAIYMPNGVYLPPAERLVDAEKVRLKTSLGLDFEKIVTFTGRITAEKNLEILLRSWVKVSAGSAEAHLVLVGEGGLERNIEKDIIKLRSELNLNNSVHLTGKVDNIFDYLIVSDVFVLPSISEGLSNSLLEAMAVGLGIVASNNPGNRQLIVHRQNGLLVDPGNEDDISSAINLLIRNEAYARELGRRAREDARENFSIKEIARRYAGVYEDLLKS